MPRQKSNIGATKATLKRGENTFSSSVKQSSEKVKTPSENISTDIYRAKSSVVKAVSTAVVRGTSPTSNGQTKAVKANVVKQDSLSEIAEKLKDRELFPEKIKRAKAFLKNLKPLPA